VLVVLEPDAHAVAPEPVEDRVPILPAESKLGLPLVERAAAVDGNIFEGSQQCGPVARSQPLTGEGNRDRWEQGRRRLPPTTRSDDDLRNGGFNPQVVGLMG
jgi:hypothetical protein